MPEKKEYEGYIIDTGARGIQGKGKGYIKFNNGVGILDLEAMAENRPDWIKADGDDFIQFAGVKLSIYADYWRDKGTKVTECSSGEAKSFRKAINSGVAPNNKFLKEPWVTKNVEIKEEPKPKDKKDEGDSLDKKPAESGKKIFSKPKKDGRE